MGPAPLFLFLEWGSFPAEAAISNGVVLRVLHLLDWPALNTDAVWPRYQAGHGRVDFASCDPPRKPAVIMEVKRPGAADAGEKQLFEYAFHQGIPMVVRSYRSLESAVLLRG